MLYPFVSIHIPSSCLSASGTIRRLRDLSSPWSELKDEIKLMLLMLDIKDVDTSEPLLLAERGKG